MKLHLLVLSTNKRENKTQACCEMDLHNPEHDSSSGSNALSTV